MLARSNRITKPYEFRHTLTSGVRVVGQNLAVHAVNASPEDSAHPARVGLIVGKACGSAVLRNQIKRRLRASSRELLPALGSGIFLVVRALPAAGTADLASLKLELSGSIQAAMRKLERRAIGSTKSESRSG